MRERAIKNPRMVWKIRTVKHYPNAHNHLIIGEVVQNTESWVRIHSRTFHFGNAVNRPEDVKVGPEMVRIIPWSSIELINELNPEFDYVKAQLVMEPNGQVLLSDGVHGCLVFMGSYKTY